MISKDARQLIEHNPVAIATCTMSVPDVAAVADVKVIDDKLIIGDNYLTKTVQNIGKNNRVVVLVWNPVWQRNCYGYKIDGTAVYETAGSNYDLVQEVHKGFPAKGAVVVTIENIKRIGD